MPGFGGPNKGPDEEFYSEGGRSDVLREMEDLIDIGSRKAKVRYERDIRIGSKGAICHENGSGEVNSRGGFSLGVDVIEDDEASFQQVLERVRSRKKRSEVLSRSAEPTLQEKIAALLNKA